MTSKSSFLFCMITLLTLFGSVQAQEPPDSLLDNNMFERLNNEIIWTQVSNPASIYERQVPDFGTAALGIQKENGHGHKPQQPSSEQQLGFSTSRYQSLDSLRFSGSFNFTRSHEDDRKWSDVLDPYRNNPYIFADEIGGDWNKQHYDLKANASTFPIADLINIGVGLHYSLATGARQNDPRPLNMLNHIRVSPGALIHLNENHTLGVQGYYADRKEEIDIMIKTPDEAFRRIKMLGMGHFNSGNMNVGYDRSYMANLYGGAFQYLFSHNDLSWLSQFRYSKSIEHIRDRIARPKNGGKFSEKNISGKTILILNKPGFIHKTQLIFSNISGDGTEYKQNYDYESERWITFSESITYHLSQQSFQWQYDLMRKSQSGHFDYQGLFNVRLDRMSQEYYLPNSRQDITSLDTHAEFIRYWNLSWRSSVSLGYCHSIEHKMKLAEIQDAIIQEQVVRPNYDYLVADKVRFSIDMTYYPPLPPGIQSRLFKQWFVNVWARRYEILDQPYHWMKSGRFFLGLRLGIHY